MSGQTVSKKSQNTHVIAIAKVNRMRLRKHDDNFLRPGEHSDEGIKCVHRFCIQSLVETPLVRVLNLN